MIDLAKHEAMRAERNLLTVAVLDQLVQECLGVVPVLCIVGKARSGKTWAAEDWFATREHDNHVVGFLDCQGSGFGGPGCLKIGSTVHPLQGDEYPKFALDGVDVVILDEGQFRPKLVNALIANTAPDAGAAAHRLIILLWQNLEQLSLLDFGDRQFMTYSTAGLPV